MYITKNIEGGRLLAVGDEELIKIQRDDIYLSSECISIPTIQERFPCLKCAASAFRAAAAFIKDI